MPTTVITVNAHPDRYEKNFDTVVVYLSQYLKKQGPSLSVKVVSTTKVKPTKR